MLNALSNQKNETIFFFVIKQGKVKKMCSNTRYLCCRGHKDQSTVLFNPNSALEKCGIDNLNRITVLKKTLKIPQIGLNPYEIISA